MTYATARLTGVLADRSAWRTDHCPIAGALDVIGTRSSLLILREAYYGTTRFDEFAERVAITDAVAAARLRELVEVGVLERVPYREAGQRTRHEYHLTESGRELLPVVLGLFEWGGKHLTSDGRAPLRMTHSGCGAPIHAEVRCTKDHRVPLAEVSVSPPRR